MKAFLDFEASSLSDQSYPIEVAWVFEDGGSESHLIAPAPTWVDWDEAAEAIHGISRATLEAEGEPHLNVAGRMVDTLAEHELFASAPSWDGKWLSALLRAAGHPRRALRLRGTDEALHSTAADHLRGVVPEASLEMEIHNLIARVSTESANPPAHRALADAQVEYRKWVRVQQAARQLADALK